MERFVSTVVLKDGSSDEGEGIDMEDLVMFKFRSERMCVALGEISACGELLQLRSEEIEEWRLNLRRLPSMYT